MNKEIILIVLIGILTIGLSYFSHIYRKNKIANLIAVLICALGLIFVIAARIYYGDSEIFNTLSIIILSLAMVAKIVSMLHERDKQKQ
jgi:4-amino-4-deoxy-L-arabinose transferase-like glycosyltransferase